MEQNHNSLSDKLDSGMRLAQKNAIEKAIATNTNLIVWSNGKVAKIPPSELKKRLKLYR